MSALRIEPRWTADAHIRRGQDTGWYVDGVWSGGSSASDHVTVENKEWYKGLNTESWNSNRPYLPDNAFLSFHDNPSRTEDIQVEVAWDLWVVGTVRLTFNGMVMFGYGNQAEGRTQRQLVDVYVDGLQQPRPAPVAKLAAARSNGGGVLYPNAAMLGSSAMTPVNYALIDSDRAIAARGYVLHQPRNVRPGGRFNAPYVSESIVDAAPGNTPRRITVRAVLTLLAVPGVSAPWVNDDVIVYPPVISVSC